MGYGTPRAALTNHGTPVIDIFTFLERCFLRSLCQKTGRDGGEWEGLALAQHFGIYLGFLYCDSDSKKPGWAADQRSVCQQVYPIRQRGS